jgi:hypothetical protein
MLNMLFWVLVGVFIGWNLPQPDWARQLQDRVLGLVRQVLRQVKGR